MKLFDLLRGRGSRFDYVMHIGTFTLKEMTSSVIRKLKFLKQYVRYVELHIYRDDFDWLGGKIFYSILLDTYQS